MADVCALARFCALHPQLVDHVPAGLFPPEDANDPNLIHRVNHTEYLALVHPNEAIDLSWWCKKAFAELQTMIFGAVNTLAGLYEDVDIRVRESELVVVALTSQLTDRDALIGQLQGQVAQFQQEVATQPIGADEAEEHNHKVETEIGISEDNTQLLQEQL